MEQINNPLYPVFIKLDKLSLLIVGAGEVAYEKLFFITKSSPNANITVVAPWASAKVQKLVADSNYNIRWYKKEIEASDISNHDIIISATNNRTINEQVFHASKHFKKIVNVADTPELCDFYMGSIVTRGDLKIAVSTNGKSPTFSKRFRQLMENILPAESHDLLQNLRIIRDKMVNDFDHKVKELNRITKSLIEEPNGTDKKIRS